MKRLLVLALCLFIIATVLGCGSGNGGPGPSPSPSPTPPPPPGTPTVSSITPANKAKNVETNATITITFSEAMRASTITGSTILVAGPMGNVGGTVSYDDDTHTATFTPASRYCLAVPYTVRVTTGVQDTGGVHMAAEFRSDFTVRDGKWSASRQVSNEDTDSVFPQAAIDASGNVIIVWAQNGDVDSVWAVRYDVNTGWGDAEQIDTSNLNADQPDIAMDASGNALAAWRQMDGSRYGIAVRRYISGSGWENEVQIIDNDNFNSSVPQVAMNDSGIAMAVWTQSDNSGSLNIYANRCVPGGAWDGAKLVDTRAEDGSNPGIVVDASGNAMAVWRQNDGVAESIYASRYEASGNWSVPRAIETSLESAMDPQLAVDPLGNVIAVWWIKVGARGEIFANRYEAGKDWGTAQLIQNGKSDGTTPRVAMDSQGNAIAVWENLHIWLEISVNRYVKGEGWGNAEPLQKDEAPKFPFAPCVAMDAAGNAIVVWGLSDNSPSYELWYSRYITRTGWGAAARIETIDNVSNVTPQVVMNASGDAVVIWRQVMETSSDIFVKLFQ